VNRPWMPLYIADYRKDTAHLSAAEHGAYLLLIMHYWSTGSLPVEDAPLARIAAMTAAMQARRMEAQKDRHRACTGRRHIQRRASAEQRHSRDANAEQLDTHARASSQSQREDAAHAAPDPEKELFARKEVLGNDAGGLIAKLLKAKNKNFDSRHRHRIPKAGSARVSAVIRGQGRPIQAIARG
jgi:uncharacterized protein YdaU (DUF1376 family)